MTTITSHCPVCDAELVLPHNTEVSEIISCFDCSTKLVVESLTNDTAILVQAPEVEEDWGQ